MNGCVVGMYYTSRFDVDEPVWANHLQLLNWLLLYSVCYVQYHHLQRQSERQNVRWDKVIGGVIVSIGQSADQSNSIHKYPPNNTIVRFLGVNHSLSQLLPIYLIDLIEHLLNDIPKTWSWSRWKMYLGNSNLGNNKQRNFRSLVITDSVAGMAIESIVYWLEIIAIHDCGWRTISFTVVQQSNPQLPGSILL